jgi:dienelactone hydrolase
MSAFVPDNLDRRAVLAAAGALVLAAPAKAGQAPAEPAFTTELTTFPSNGKAIRAAVFRPTANARGSGVVLMHGSGGIGPEQVVLGEKFAADGYVAVVPTYLDAAADDVIRPEPVMNAWRDCGSDAIEWLIGQGLDRGRTGIMGYSLGSHIAVDGALGDSRAAAAISVAGGWDVYIPRRPARRIPVLLISAERDRVVSPNSTARWRRFLIDADVPVRARTVRGAGHLMTRRQWDQVYAYALDFFNGNIGRLSQ